MRIEFPSTWFSSQGEVNERVRPFFKQILSDVTVDTSEASIQKSSIFISNYLPFDFFLTTSFTAPFFSAA